MSPADWLAKARQNSDSLVSLIAAWHPASPTFPGTHGMPITAGAAERMCAHARAQIKAEDVGEHSPATRFTLALERGDWAEALAILSETWFGVPESTDCWRIPGFAVCVDLLDETPEWDGEDDELGRQQPTHEDSSESELDSAAQP